MLDHQRIDGVRLKIFTVEVFLMLSIAILVIGGQPLDPKQTPLTFLVRPFAWSLSPKQILAIRFLFAKRACLPAKLCPLFSGFLFGGKNFLLNLIA